MASIYESDVHIPDPPSIGGVSGDLGYDRIMVTGANGYLGSHIVYYLLEAGYRVKAIVHDKSNRDGWDHL
jgi:hypothetical protein